MNQVALVGNITDDPTLRYTQSGKAVANFTLAVSHRSKSNGRWNDVTDGFFTVTCWNSLAENVAQSLKKGSRRSSHRQADPTHLRDRRQQAHRRRDRGQPRWS